MSPDPTPIDGSTENWLEDLRTVERLLRESDSFCWVGPQGYDAYSIEHAITLSTQLKVEFSLILDRNVLSRVLELPTTTRKATTDLHRLGASVMTLALLSDMHFDATTAVGETVLVNQTGQGQNDAAKLAAMQNLDAESYLDIVMNRATHIDPKSIDAEMTPAMIDGAAKLQVDLWKWVRPHYGAALKLATLLYSCTTVEERFKAFKEYLRWSYDDYMFIPGALIYGSLAMSPNHPGGMFKWLNSPMLDRPLEGVWNVAWDTFLLDYWAKEAQRAAIKNMVVILCTFDRPLRTCARDFVVPHLDAAQRLEKLEKRFTLEWPSEMGKALHSQYVRYALGATTDHTRAAHRHRNQQAYWSAMVDCLESDFHQIIGK